MVLDQRIPICRKWPVQPPGLYNPFWQIQGRFYLLRILRHHCYFLQVKELPVVPLLRP